jgi:DNA-binding HxlR family transcriptional regulator
MERRSYNQYCGLAKALDVLGERWTLLIVRNMLLGPLRYSDLLRGLPGITTNLLAKRLREMEDFGLIERVRGSTGDGGQAYRLTVVGAELEPVVHALGRWAWSWMEPPTKGELRSIEWLLVALRRRYHGGGALRAELIVDDVPYRIILSPASAEIARGEVSSPDVRIRASGDAAMRLFLEKRWRGRAPAGVEVQGKADALRTLVNAFAANELDARATAG